MAIDTDPTQLMRDLRGMTGNDHVGRTAHNAVTEIGRLRDALTLVASCAMQQLREGPDTMMNDAKVENDLPEIIDRDSLEWLDMMAKYGPLDCRPMMWRIREEMTILLQSHEDGKEFVKTMGKILGVK